MGSTVLTAQAYKKMIHSIQVPANLSPEDQINRYQPLNDFLQAETPKELFRFTSLVYSAS